MPYQNLQAVLSDDALTDIATNLAQVRGLLPFLVNLTPEECKHLGRKAHDRYAFLKEAQDIARANPGLLPGVFDQAGWESDIALYDALRAVLQQVAVLYEALTDTVLALRVECQERAADVRDQVAIAARRNVPGMDVLLERLRAADGKR